MPPSSVAKLAYVHTREGVRENLRCWSNACWLRKERSQSLQLNVSAWAGESRCWSNACWLPKERLQSSQSYSGACAGALLRCWSNACWLPKERSQSLQLNAGAWAGELRCCCNDCLPLKCLSQVAQQWDMFKIRSDIERHWCVDRGDSNSQQGESGKNVAARLYPAAERLRLADGCNVECPTRYKLFS